jgi:hypothetical protein
MKMYHHDISEAMASRTMTAWTGTEAWMMR